MALVIKYEATRKVNSTFKGKTLPDTIFKHGLAAEQWRVVTTGSPRQNEQQQLGKQDTRQ